MTLTEIIITALAAVAAAAALAALIVVCVRTRGGGVDADLLNDVRKMLEESADGRSQEIQRTVNNAKDVTLSVINQSNSSVATAIGTYLKGSGESMDKLIENTAKEILEAPLTEGAMAAENLEGVIKYAVDSGTTVKSDLLTLINDLSEEGGCGALPVISVIEEKNSESGSQQQEQGGSQSEQQSGKYIEIKKTAILKDKKAVGVLDFTFSCRPLPGCKRERIVGNSSRKP